MHYVFCSHGGMQCPYSASPVFDCGVILDCCAIGQRRAQCRNGLCLWLSVFDVGGGLLPQEDDHGGRFFTEWWHANQNQNWIGKSKGPAAANADKQVLTNWYTAGFQYTFNREWSVMARLPYANRSFTTDTDFPNGMLQTFNSRSIGDVELMGMYTGFSKDMSTGVIFGLKLPSGMFTAPGFDRDTQIGTGSTDLILGAFHRGMITGDNAWQYFVQVRWQQPFLTSPPSIPTRQHGSLQARLSNRWHCRYHLQ